MAGTSETTPDLNCMIALNPWTALALLSSILFEARNGIEAHKTYVYCDMYQGLMEHDPSSPFQEGPLMSAGDIKLLHQTLATWYATLEVKVIPSAKT